VLPVAASELRDLRVDAHELWGADAARVEHDLSSRTPRDAARVLERHVASLSLDADGTAHADAVRTRVLRAPVDAIADDLGVTTRTLHRRCLDAFGYGPKTLQRVQRFRRFLTLAERSPDANLARLAADAGYADQPHLNHESARLAGLAPGELLASRGVRSVQDAAAPDR
jgi:methylphosphotriester-DNA--protein-cysteine methyltransferase